MFHIRNAKFVLISQGFFTSPVSKNGQSSLFGRSMKPSILWRGPLGAILGWQASWPDNRSHRSGQDPSLSSTSSSEWGSPEEETFVSLNNWICILVIGGVDLGGNCSGTSLCCWEQTWDLRLHLLRQRLAAQIIVFDKFTFLSLPVHWSLHKRFCWWRGCDNVGQVLVRIAQVPLRELVEVAVSVGWECVVMLNHPAIKHNLEASGSDFWLTFSKPYAPLLPSSWSLCRPTASALGTS